MCLPMQLPSIITLRDEIQSKFNYAQTLRVGAGGGIGTPESALAAFNMGAAYIVLGSVNQSCIEAGADVYFRVKDPVKSVTNVQDLNHLTRIISQTIMQKHLGLTPSDVGWGGRRIR